VDIKEEKEILNFYNQSVDEERLSKGIGVLEFERSKDIIKRYLSDKNEVIYDIGGATGIYSRWLSSMNKEVHMFELAPKAVEYAKSLQEKERIKV
jgi:2-polyprenyl-3-methyl-5-hydroxy-6-metoxy-1,4-benzoquinol methylase